MKKNLFFGLMALVGLFTSCSRDDAYTSPTEESNQVSMSIDMPADFVKTRAAAPATFPSGHTLRCILEVWTQDGTTRKVRQEQLVTAGAANITFNFELADQGDYKAVLWADYIASGASATDGHYPDKYYKTDDANGLKKVTVITTAYTYTDQVREAFTAVEPFAKGATAKNDLTATLVRPLTKVTIAEKNAEMFAKCTGMTATYTVPSEFNALSEGVSTTATYDATYNAAPMGGTDITINGTNCKILFSDYVFTAADGTMGGIELTFTGSVTLNDRSIPANIPLKRNNWVRAAGNLITAAVTGYDPAVTLSVDMTTDWVNQDATDIPDIVEAKVGDYYYSDGTWSTTLDENKTCIGIVFQTDLSRIGAKEKEVLAAKGVAVPHGLVMAVKNISTQNRGWSSEIYNFPELTDCVTKEECAADINGLYNYTTVIDYAEQNGKLDSYPVFRDIKNYSVATPVKTTGWYMPSIGQLYDFFTNLGGLPGLENATKSVVNDGYIWSGQTELLTRVNAYLSPLGVGNYDEFYPDINYIWSSSELNANSVRSWQIYNDGYIACTLRGKNKIDQILRPVLAF